MRFGARFAAQRKKKHLTVEATAKDCGISRSYVVLIEGGKRRPSIKIFHKIANTLGVPVNIILNWYLEDMKERLKKDLA